VVVADFERWEGAEDVATALRPDVMLIDVSPWRTEGLELARRLSVRAEPPAIVLMSASPSDAILAASGGTNIYRGLTYGGGSLWVSEAEQPPREPHLVTQLDPQTGRQRSIWIPGPGDPLAWSGGYGDLWVSNFPVGTLTRIHTPTRAVRTITAASANPGPIVVDGDAVWVGDWSTRASSGCVRSESARHTRSPCPCETPKQECGASQPERGMCGRPRRATTRCGGSTRSPTPSRASPCRTRRMA
jgi:hypothetical protein